MEQNPMRGKFDTNITIPSWVQTVLLTRYSAAWAPEGPLVRGRCDAQIAPEFRNAFPHGCQRRSGHSGDHTPFEGIGLKMDEYMRVTR